MQATKEFFADRAVNAAHRTREVERAWGDSPQERDALSKGIRPRDSRHDGPAGRRVSDPATLAARTQRLKSKAAALSRSASRSKKEATLAYLQSGGELNPGPFFHGMSFEVDSNRACWLGWTGYSFAPGRFFREAVFIKDAQLIQVYRWRTDTRVLVVVFHDHYETCYVMIHPSDLVLRFSDLLLGGDIEPNPGPGPRHFKRLRCIGEDKYIHGKVARCPRDGDCLFGREVVASHDLRFCAKCGVVCESRMEEGFQTFWIHPRQADTSCGPKTAAAADSPGPEVPENPLGDGLERSSSCEPIEGPVYDRPDPAIGGIVPPSYQAPVLSELPLPSQPAPELPMELAVPAEPAPVLPVPVSPAPILVLGEDDVAPDHTPEISKPAANTEDYPFGPPPPLPTEPHPLLAAGAISCAFLRRGRRRLRHVLPKERKCLRGYVLQTAEERVKLVDELGCPPSVPLTRPEVTQVVREMPFIRECRVSPDRNVKPIEEDLEVVDVSVTGRTWNRARVFYWACHLALSISTAVMIASVMAMATYHRQPVVIRKWNPVIEFLAPVLPSWFLNLTVDETTIAFDPRRAFSGTQILISALSAACTSSLLLGGFFRLTKRLWDNQMFTGLIVPYEMRMAYVPHALTSGLIEYRPGADVSDFEQKLLRQATLPIPDDLRLQLQRGTAVAARCTSESVQLGFRAAHDHGTRVVRVLSL